MTRCAACSAASLVCCHSRQLAGDSGHSESASLLPHEYKQLMLLVFKQGARWQQLYSPLDGRSANVTVLALPPLGWLLDVVGFMIKIHLQRFIIPED